MNNWIQQIDHTTEEFLKLYGLLSYEELNWKPNPDTWSIAQNVDHIMVINHTYFPILSAMKAGEYQRPFIANFGFIVSFLGKTILNAVQPDRKKKIKTFPIWEPDNDPISSDLRQRFSEHQALLKQEIESSEKLIEIGAVISSPANKNIVYKLEIAFDIIITHELRHLEQSKEVLELLKKEVQLVSSI